jgi:membrane-associated phospholipid phosphatase
MSRARQLTQLSLLAALVCVAVYVVALGTAWGLDADERALPSGVSGPTWEDAHHALHRIVDTIHVATIAVAGLLAVFVALRRKRNDLALVAVATLIGANVTTAVLKPLLGRTDPLGGEAERLLSDSFPSGHATAAMSLALIAVIVSPRRWRPAVALAAAGYAAAVGVGLVVIFAHYPSDVVGGYMVAGAWATAMAAIALVRSERVAPVPPARTPPLGTVLTVAGLVVAVGGLLLAPASRLGHGVFAVSAVAIAGLALLLPVGLTFLLSRPPEKQHR